MRMRQSYPTEEQLANAIKLIGSSVENEKSDAMFYEWLINNIPTYLDENTRQDLVKTITGIKEDEQMHNKIFKNMYKQLTGRDIPTPMEEEFTPPASFKEGVIKALKGEMEAVRRYRTIMAGLPDVSYRDAVFHVLTDELRHGTLYNYIYTTIMK